MCRPSRSPRLVALVAAAVALLGIAVPATQAGADATSDKRAEAARLAAQLDADNRQVDSLTARFEAAQLQASDLDARVNATAASLAAAKDRIDQTRTTVRDLAVDEYIKRGTTPDPVDAVSRQGDLRATALAKVFADVAVSETQDALDANKAAQEDYAAQLKQLQADQKRAHDAAAAVQTAQRAAEAAAAQQKARLDKVNGELAQLVAAEQARLQAAREAQAREAAQRAAPRPSIAYQPVPGQPAPPVDSSRAAIAVAAAQQQLGKPYRWGGAGPNNFDCSGLTMWAWRAAGVSLPHYTGAQYANTVHISVAELQPGDLVFFHSDLSHMGIYVGNGQMIHAPHTGDVVRYASIYSEGSPIYAGRVTG